MNIRASFSLRGRNPDVLTCIANLSNDEVFTPPELANRMLDTLAEAWAADNDGANIWADKTVKFFDPCTKSGVFLREVTRRLTEGLAEAMPSLEERVHHILTKQVFGIGITKLTSLLARRGVYCSKHANGEHSIAKDFADSDGNIWFERTEHTWAGGKCAYCGARQQTLDRGEGLETHAYAFIHTDNIKARLSSVFGGDMQFDVIIGNPPYQLSTGGGTATQQARPLYHLFVEQAKGLKPRYVSMVIPSRWFSGGMNLDGFRAAMLSDHHLRNLVDFPDSRDAFAGVDIAGGISYFLWDASYIGPCSIATVKNGALGVPVARRLDAFDVLVRDNDAVRILEKVLSDPHFVSLSNMVSAVSPFGLPTSFRGQVTPEGLTDPIIVRSTAGRQYAERTAVTKNLTWIDEWKVLLSATASEHAGQAGKDGTRRVFSRIEVLEPGVATTHSYLIVGPIADEAMARRIVDYLRTRLVRFLASVSIITQHVSKATFSFVPAQDFSRAWTDADLYAKYSITPDEVAYIKSMIRPMENGDG